MKFTLRSGRQIPAIAFGTGTTYFQRNDDVENGILQAFGKGFRYIDTAIMYNTEEGVGKAIKKLIDDKNYDREDIFVATKVNSDQFTYDMVMKAMNDSMKRLGLKYVDLVLIHSPGIPKNYNFLAKELLEACPKTPNELKEARMAMWEALQELKKMGKIREIGVSNFNRFHLEQLIKDPRCKEIPVVNQIELNPYCVDHDIIEACRENKILVQAYSPLGSDPGRSEAKKFKKLLDDEVLIGIASKRGCSTAQVALKWALTKGISIVTKTEKEARMTENLESENVELSDDDIKLIDGLNLNQRLFWNPYDIL